MAFSDLKDLEQHLSTRSYVEGYEPSQADVGVYNALRSAPSASEYPHAARWYQHITSYKAEHPNLPGDKEAGAKLYAPSSSSAPATAAAPADAAKGDDDDDIDLFGSDDEEEDAAAAKLKADRLAEYEAKKAKKTKTIAKSIVTLDVKPWDDETDMEALEKSVRSIEMPGLLWGASKFLAIGYGIKKLQINIVIEDELVSVDELQEKIADFEDYVQSTDVFAMQKL